MKKQDFMIYKRGIENLIKEQFVYIYVDESTDEIIKKQFNTEEELYQFKLKRIIDKL